MNSKKITEFFLAMLPILLFLYLIFGGLLESKESKNKYRIDCNKNPRLCDELNQKLYEDELDSAKDDYYYSHTAIGR